MGDLDRAALLAFLAHRGEATRSVLLQAAYTGLRERILRGDFDTDRKDARPWA